MTGPHTTRGGDGDAEKRGVRHSSRVTNPSRRDVLKTGGVALAATVGVTNTTGTAAADGHFAHFDEWPEHVTISTDPADIEPWQPRLTWDRYPEYEPLGYWAFRASSPEYDTDVIVGFHKYAQQDTGRSVDSHAGDHEPVYVFFDPGTGDVQDVVCSGYHWYRMTIPESSIRTVETDDGEQPVLRVVTPWHHHLPTAPEESRDGRTFAVEDLHGDLDSWLRNGHEDSLRVDQPFHPWVMREAEDWWQDGAKSWVELLLQEMYVSLGFGDVPEREETGWEHQ